MYTSACKYIPKVENVKILTDMALCKGKPRPSLFISWVTVAFISFFWISVQGGLMEVAILVAFHVGTQARRTRR